MKRLLLALTLVACGRKTAPPETIAVSLTADVAPPIAVWIDVDPSVGERDRDVDDGLALLAALASPGLRIVGVSSVFGNAPLHRADPIMRQLMGAWAPDVPLFTGAASADAAPTVATAGLIAALEAEPLTILALGPATNVATVLRERPDLAGRVERIVAVAGRLPGQRFTTGTVNTRSHRDFNFEQDPDAFQVLLEADVELMLAPFELSRKVWVTEPFLAGLEAGASSRLLVAPSRRWLELWRATFEVDGFNPFDTLAVGALVRPELITCRPGRGRIEVGRDDRTEAMMQGTDGPTKPYLIVADEGERGAAVTWCHGVDSEAFLTDLSERLLSR